MTTIRGFTLEEMILGYNEMGNLNLQIANIEIYDNYEGDVNLQWEFILKQD